MTVPSSPGRSRLIGCVPRRLAVLASTLPFGPTTWVKVPPRPAGSCAGSWPSRTRAATSAT
ncbi:MAG: hypothetical protein J2P57_24620 [Acidimicrobiaceae bacterium]|nr:hypothetical protein [Acidimicrobiaceae bacterium]